VGLKLKRKIFKVGQSYAVTLPPAWVSYYGSKVAEVTIIGSDLLIIAPAGLELQAEGMAVVRERGLETQTEIIKGE